MLGDELKIINEADAWFQKWIKALPKYGNDQRYWNKVLEVAWNFSKKYGTLGYVLMIRRVEVLEKKWSDLNGN